MEALISDPKTTELDMLLIQEPPFTFYKTPVIYPQWRPTGKCNATARTLMQSKSISAYIQCGEASRSGNEMDSALDMINSTILQTLRNKVVISGDFNHHHQLWGGIDISQRWLRDTDELLSFIQTHHLQSCLPTVVSTHWSSG
ncbi:hypothetical protein PAAG_03427 [Paracoccidioides lutzii Pb01]|uniref:Endonuclease/exonuclease/phosphatase domain-containing protein n=1 Tax=Paracoccidioides lutzii (strain ATCC MYA-826 / Pb01) TaxID=502779 RepID=C1GX53_PARBA|nr:hypothetical protein PAAG_03427 [Paracoccidioides lutzii Pb01]EEH41141.2 hypothetical protein PAAG_03427 [Paracoccidioides lutzii Pb01]